MSAYVITAYTIGVLVFVVGVGVSIALHEIGHLVPAKLFGVRCTQYMVGFGRTLWSRKMGETEYGVKVIPLGGYVRMLGMFPPRPGRPISADSTGRWSMVIEQARHDAMREVGPEDADRLFYQRSVPRRMIIMLGGPTMNLLLGFALLAVLLTAFGVSTDTPKVSSVSQCVLPADAPYRDCRPDDKPAPAAKAGLKPGDLIVAFDGVKVTTWAEVRDRIRANHGTPVQLTVRRDGQELTLTATPLVDDKRPVLDSDGNPVLGSDGKYKVESAGFLGVSPTKAVVRQPLSAVPGVFGDTLGKIAGVVFRIPEKMVGVGKAAFGSGQRDPNGPISVVGAARLSGEAVSAQGTAEAPITIGDKVAFVISLLASINLALFVFNLIPLLPLDGGHVAGAVWEGIRRRANRLLRRPDPGPVDMARALPLTYGVASLLIGMSVLLIYADLVRPIRLGG